ncbi:putative copper-transporting ATPase 3 [Bisporella sp. PMI_857]|nr:putative copper-transporting ATPase 3 [Bisporella sp. PMI_857]
MSAPTNTAKMISSSYMLSNLHCHSCVSHIDNVLSTLHPQPRSISTSLVLSLVTVEHEELLPVGGIQGALEDAGFDVYHVSPENSVGDKRKIFRDCIGYLDRFVDKWYLESSTRNRPVSKHEDKHLQHCEACRLEASVEQKRSHGMSPSPDDHENEKESGHDAAKDRAVSFVVIDSDQIEDVWRATMAIGGMTCASCVGMISEELGRKDWVRDVAINLISNSGTVDFVGKEHKDDLVEAIEDIGYEAAIDNVVGLRGQNSLTGRTSRTIEIKVDGIFCNHCPAQVLASLERFGESVKIEKALTVDDSILRISYTPHVPAFTIRTIIDAISELDPLSPSVYHPPTLEERSQKLHARERRRLFVRVLFTFLIGIPTLVIGIIFMSLVPSHNPGRHFLMKSLSAGISRAQWILFGLATPVYFLCADVFHTRALKEIKSMWRPGSTTPILQRLYRFGSMNMLMSLGTSIAYISSVAQLIAAGIRRRSMVDNSVFYFDSVVFLTLFLLLGRLIEAYSKSKTGDAVLMLGMLKPTETLLVETTGDKQINAELLEIGDVVKVLHGGSPPCDGKVVQGETRFDESSLTGESKPIQKIVGDEVYSGSINKGSPISVEITGISGTSMLDQIVRAVREGQTRRAPMERIADSLTAYFVPLVTLSAVITWIVWLSLGVSGILPLSYRGENSDGWVAWSLQFAIAVFVVACPCGLALAAPTALFVGGGLAAQHGILAKGGGEAFENASRLECIVFDKTGTLTVGGEPIVTDYKIEQCGEGQDGSKGMNRFSEAGVLEIVGSVEANSSHTVAKAITWFCASKDVKTSHASDIEEFPGRGMKGKAYLEGSTIELVIGNEIFMHENSVLILADTKIKLDCWKSEGKSVALAAIRETSQSLNWRLVAVFAVSDPIRPEAPSIVQYLRQQGMDVWMLSGDNQTTANAIASQVGIISTNVIADVLPSQKAERIQHLQKVLKSRKSGVENSSKRAMVAMVGDGINDAPALTAADVGIAVGSGSDIAISSAEFVLISSNLYTLLTLLDLSKVVFRRIKFNFAWALVYNMIALPVAAGVLYPIGGRHIRLDPVWASKCCSTSPDFLKFKALHVYIY